MKSKVIALSAVASAIIAILLTIGTYFEITDLFMLVTASIFVLLPLYYNSYKASVLAFLVGGLIAILCSGFNFALIYPAYYLFFGIYPIIKCWMTSKKVNNNLSIIIGLVWFVIVSIVCYFYYTLVLNGIFEGLPLWITDYIIYFVIVVAIVFFFIYNRFVVVIKANLDKYLSKIIK